jgi:hypothetical protein
MWYKYQANRTAAFTNSALSALRPAAALPTPAVVLTGSALQLPAVQLLPSGLSIFAKILASQGFADLMLQMQLSQLQQYVPFSPPRASDEDVTAATCAVLCKLLYDGDGTTAKMSDLLQKAKTRQTPYHKYHAAVYGRLQSLGIARDECTLNVACFSSGTELFIVCKGTNNCWDLLEDLGIFFWNEPFTRVRNTLKYVHPWVADHLNDITSYNAQHWNDVPVNRKEKKRIIFTGHSLGGTVAYLASAHYLWRSGVDFMLHELHMFNPGRGLFPHLDPRFNTIFEVLDHLQKTQQNGVVFKGTTGRQCAHCIKGDSVSSWAIPSALQHHIVTYEYEISETGWLLTQHFLNNFLDSQPAGLLPYTKQNAANAKSRRVTSGQTTWSEFVPP